MSQFDYSKYTSDAEVTAQASFRMKDGAGGKSFFDPEKMQDIPRHKPALGVYVMDVIMAAAGANHPLVVMGKLKPDQLTHICWVYVHKGLGPNNDWFICMARTYGKPCFACEHRNVLMADPAVSTEAANVFGTGKYPIGIYNTVHHLNPNQMTWAEPIEVWDINNAFMESHLQGRAKQPMITPDNPTGYINYMWPTAGVQGGRHIKYEVVQKGQYFDYKNHEFYQRQNPVPPHVLERAYCLSELLYIPEYDEVKDVVLAGMHEPIGGQPTGETFAPQDFGTFSGPSGLEAGFDQPSAAPVFGTPEPRCPFAEYGGVIGQTLDKWVECQTCELRVTCVEASPKAATPAAQPPSPTPAPEPAQPTPAAAAPPPQPPAPAQARPAPIPRRPQK
jgi:hypothetical protein